MPLNLPDVAKEIISELSSPGGVFYVCYEVGGGEDPDTGAPITGTKERVTTAGVRKNYNLNLIDGTNIKSGDFELVVPFDTELPDGCWIEDGKYRYSIVGTIEVNHSGTIEVSKLQLRRS